MKNTSTKDKKEYYQENKEKIAEYQREYYQKNKEKIKEYQRKYYQENKEKILEHIRNYYKEKRQNKHNNKCNMDCLNCIYDDCIMS